LKDLVSRVYLLIIKDLDDEPFLDEMIINGHFDKEYLLIKKGYRLLS